MTKNYYINIKKVIIIENLNLSKLNQKILKNLIEKNIYIKFIIITNNYNSIIHNIKSYFLYVNYKEFNTNIYFNNVVYNNDLYYNIINYIDYILTKKITKKHFKDIKTFSYLLLMNNISINYIYNLILDYLIKNDYKNIKLFIDYFITLDNHYKNNYLRLFYYEYYLFIVII